MVSASLVKDLREKTGAGMLDCKKALEATDGNIEEAVNWLREKGISKAAKKASRVAADGISSILIDGNQAVIVEVNSETDFVAKNEEFLEMVSEILKTIIKNNVSNVEEALKLTTSNGTTIESLIIDKTAKIGEKLSLRRFEKIVKKDNEQFGSYIHMGGRIATLIVTSNTKESVAKDVAMHAAAMRPQYLKSTDVPKDVLEKEKEIITEQLINEGKPKDKIDKILVGKVNKYYEDVVLENQIYIKALNKETVAKYVADNGGKIELMVRYEVGEGIEKVQENFADEVAKQIKNI